MCCTVLKKSCDSCLLLTDAVALQPCSSHVGQRSLQKRYFHDRELPSDVRAGGGDEEGLGFFRNSPDLDDNEVEVQSTHPFPRTQEGSLAEVKPDQRRFKNAAIFPAVAFPKSRAEGLSRKDGRGGERGRKGRKGITWRAREDL